MLTMNRATLVGHAGRNPEMRTLPSGDEVASFSLATTERFKRRDGTEGEATEWHAIVAFGAAAEAVRTLVRRGDPVLVEGRIATRSWTDRKGVEHRTTEILVSGPRAQVNVLAKRRREPGGNDEPPGGAAAAGAGKAADADRDEGSADAVAVAGSARRTDTGTVEDAGAGSEADAGSGSEGDSAVEADVANTVQKDEAGGGAHEDTGHGGGDGDAAGPPKDTASAEAASAGTEGDATAAADKSGGPQSSEADDAAGRTSDGDSPKGSAGDAEGTDPGDDGVAGHD